MTLVRNVRVDVMKKGTSLTRERSPLGLYQRPVPKVLGEGAVSNRRDTPVELSEDLLFRIEPRLDVSLIKTQKRYVDFLH